MRIRLRFPLHIRIFNIYTVPVVLLLGMMNVFGKSSDDNLVAMQQKLAAHLNQAKSIQADFVQTRHLAEFDMTVSIKGQLAVEHSGRMAWYVREPLEFLCVISPGELRQWDADSKNVTTIPMKKMPWLRAINESMHGYLSGDLTQLRRSFELEAAGEHRLKLIPKQGFLQGFVNSMILEFTPDFSAVRSIVIHEKNSDSMRIEFTRIRLNEPIPEKRWQLPPK